MRKLELDEPVVLPCSEKLTLVSMLRGTAIIAATCYILPNDAGVTKGQNLVGISKKSIKPLIEFLQRLDLTLEG